MATHTHVLVVVFSRCVVLCTVPNDWETVQFVGRHSVGSEAGGTSERSCCVRVVGGTVGYLCDADGVGQQQQETWLALNTRTISDGVSGRIGFAVGHVGQTQLLQRAQSESCVAHLAHIPCVSLTVSNGQPTHSSIQSEVSYALNAFGNGSVVSGLAVGKSQSLTSRLVDQRESTDAL